MKIVVLPAIIVGIASVEAVLVTALAIPPMHFFWLFLCVAIFGIITCGIGAAAGDSLIVSLIDEWDERSFRPRSMLRRLVCRINYYYRRI